MHRLCGAGDGRHIRPLDAAPRPGHASPFIYDDAELAGQDLLETSGSQPPLGQRKSAKYDGFNAVISHFWHFRRVRFPTAMVRFRTGVFERQQHFELNRLYC
jgi:hypothetical protein